MAESALNIFSGAFDPAEDIDGIDIVNIDLDKINAESIDGAAELIENLSKLYYDDDFMKENPQFKKRIDNELENLRVLIKMRKADEETHDILIKAIAGNSNNASLYRALSEIQKTILSIITKIEATITNLNNMLKCYQLEFNFKESEEETESEDSSIENSDPVDPSTCRGSKEFIERMRHNVLEESSEEETV